MEYYDDRTIKTLTLPNRTVEFNYNSNNLLNYRLDRYNSSSYSSDTEETINYDSSNLINQYSLHNDDKNYNSEINVLYDNTNAIEMQRTWSYDTDNGRMEACTNVKYEYDNNGNLICLNIETSGGDDVLYSGYLTNNIVSGDIYIEYTEFRIPLNDFPKFFFNEYLKAIHSLYLHLYNATGVDARLGISKLYSYDNSCGIIISIRESYYGLLYTGNVLNTNINYDDLSLSMDDVYAFYGE